MKRIEWAIALGCMCGMGSAAFAEDKSEVITAVEVNVNGEVLHGQEALDALPSGLEDLVRDVTESVQSATSKLDANGDGKVDDQERKAASERLREQVDRWRTHSKAQRNLSKYDKNKDGILSDAEKLQMAEDQKAEDESKKQAQAQHKQALLEAYDTNDNGKIDPEELKVIQAKAKTLLAEANVILAGEAALRVDQDQVLAPVVREIRTGLHGGSSQGWSMVRRD